ncbi:MAG: hypothetical protein ACRELY_02130 [Polyangiaceae bacterium]
MGRRQSALLLLIASAVACHKNDATLVVGVESQPAIVSRIGKVRYVAKVEGKVIVDKEIVPKTGQSPFPLEVRVDGESAKSADVAIITYAAGPNDTILGDNPMLVRRVIAPFVKGPPKLARVRLEGSCLTSTPGFHGPACPADQTCTSGRCIDPTLIADDLEAYAQDWAKNRPDVCKPPHAGAPEIAAGTGQTDFVALQGGETLTPEKGPQGGHHLWIAVRQKNLKQQGSTVTLSAEQPGTDLKVPPTSFIFPFESADAGYCKLYGLRLQLDNSTVPVQKFLGQPLDVKIVVSDTDGQTAEQIAHVKVGPTTIGD